VLVGGIDELTFAAYEDRGNVNREEWLVRGRKGRYETGYCMLLRDAI